MMGRRSGRPPSWSRVNPLLRPMTPYPSSFKHCPGCEGQVAADDTGAGVDTYGRRWHGACLNPPEVPKCVLCRDDLATGPQAVTDTEGRQWHETCAAPFVAAGALTLGAAS